MLAIFLEADYKHTYFKSDSACVTQSRAIPSEILNLYVCADFQCKWLKQLMNLSVKLPFEMIFNSLSSVLKSLYCLCFISKIEKTILFFTPSPRAKARLALSQASSFQGRAALSSSGQTAYHNDCRKKTPSSFKTSSGPLNILERCLNCSSMPFTFQIVMVCPWLESYPWLVKANETEKRMSFFQPQYRHKMLL